MSTFNTKCPACGTNLSINNEWKNKTLLCPKCQNKFRLDESSTSKTQNAESETKTQVCPRCGSIVEPKKLFCSHCGTRRSAPSRICCNPNCRSAIKPGMHFCHRCGELYVESYKTAFEKNLNRIGETTGDILTKGGQKIASFFNSISAPPKK